VIVLWILLLLFDACQSSTETDTYGQAASNLVAGSNFEQAVQGILDMGGGTWDRETVVRALRAAYNNPERAVDYLYSVRLILLVMNVFYLPSFLNVRNLT